MCSWFDPWWYHTIRMVKLLDTRDLKSSEQQCSYGFKSCSEYNKKCNSYFEGLRFLYSEINIVLLYMIPNDLIYLVCVRDGSGILLRFPKVLS